MRTNQPTLQLALLIALGVQAALAQSGGVMVKPTDDQIPRGAQALTIVPMSFANQSSYYLRHSLDAGSLVVAAIPAAIAMADPPVRYPREWRAGGAAFGRNYGNALAAVTAANTGKYLTGVLFREDPRYYPDTSTNVVHRVYHALAFTVVDRSVQGRPRLAISNFAGALAGGFTGSGYLPDGYSDNTHALQRASGIFGGYLGTQAAGFATANLFAEFTPELRALARKLHLPFVK